MSDTERLNDLDLAINLRDARESGRMIFVEKIHAEALARGAEVSRLKEDKAALEVQLAECFHLSEALEQVAEKAKKLQRVLHGTGTWPHGLDEALSALERTKSGGEEG